MHIRCALMAISLLLFLQLVILCVQFCLVGMGNHPCEACGSLTSMSADHSCTIKLLIYTFTCNLGDQ